MVYNNVFQWPRQDSWAFYQIRKIGCCACAGNAGNAFPATTSKQSRHASRHVCDARALMHAGIASSFRWSWWRGKTFRHSGRMRTRNFMYLARPPWDLGFYTETWTGASATVQRYFQMIRYFPQRCDDTSSRLVSVHSKVGQWLKDLQTRHDALVKQVHSYPWTHTLRFSRNSVDGL